MSYEEHFESFCPHRELAQQLLDVVTQERLHIRALELDALEELSQQRHEIAREVLQLAQEEPISEMAGHFYKRAYQMAEDNVKILQNTRGAVAALLGQLRGTQTVYTARGQTKHRTTTPGLLGWDG